MCSLADVLSVLLFQEVFNNLSRLKTAPTFYKCNFIFTKTLIRNKTTRILRKAFCCYVLLSNWIGNRQLVYLSVPRRQTTFSLSFNLAEWWDKRRKIKQTANRFNRMKFHRLGYMLTHRTSNLFFICFLLWKFSKGRRKFLSHVHIFSYVISIPRKNFSGKQNWHIDETAVGSCKHVISW